MVEDLSNVLDSDRVKLKDLLVMARLNVSFNLFVQGIVPHFVNIISIKAKV